MQSKWPELQNRGTVTRMVMPGCEGKLPAYWADASGRPILWEQSAERFMSSGTIGLATCNVSDISKERINQRLGSKSKYGAALAWQPSDIEAGSRAVHFGDGYVVCQLKN